MNNRLSIQDLADLLAEHTGKDRKSTERFLWEFIAIVTDGIYTDKLVKVKGLGTFKVVPVEERESIHVNTGERFTIPAHDKFSFLPDKELRDLINRPFSFFETTELAPDIHFADMDVFSEKQPDGGTEIEEETVEEHFPETIQPPEKDAGSEISEDELPDSTEKKKKMQRWSVIGLILLLAGVFISVFYLNKETVKGIRESRLVISDTIEVENEDTIQSSLQMSAPDSSSHPMEKEADAISRHSESLSEKVIAQVKIQPGSRLTLIALKYYGHKLFWVYIYEYNKAIIRDPNNIPIGTVLDVPAPDIYGIDHHDRHSLERAAIRQTEILNKEQ